MLSIFLLNISHTVLGHVELLVHQHPKSFSPEVFSIHSLLSLYLCQGLPSPTCKTLYLTLLKFMMFTQAQLSGLSRSLQMVSFPSSVSLHTAPHSLESSANLLGVPGIVFSTTVSATTIMTRSSDYKSSQVYKLQRDVHLN